MGVQVECSRRALRVLQRWKMEERHSKPHPGHVVPKHVTHEIARETCFMFLAPHPPGPLDPPLTLLD